MSEPLTGWEGQSGPGPSCSGALGGVADVVAVVDAPRVREAVTVLLGGLLFTTGLMVAAAVTGLRGGPMTWSVTPDGSGTRGS